jgi:hypothetical protein
MQGRRPLDERLLEDFLVLDTSAPSSSTIDPLLKEAIARTRDEIAKAFSTRTTLKVKLVN